MVLRLNVPRRSAGDPRVRHRCAAAAVAAIALVAAAPPSARAGERAAGGRPQTLISEGVRLLWRASLPEGALPYGRPAADRERFFIGLEDGVRAFDTSSGRLLWSAPHHELLPRALVLADDLLIAAEAVVTARDARTGAERWRFVPEDHAALGQPGRGRGVYYFGTAGHRLYALDQRSGRLRWSADVGRGFAHQGVVRGVAAGGDAVYAAVEEWRTPNGHHTSGHVVALDRRTGAERWRFVAGSGDERRGASSAPVLAGRLVLVSDYLGNALYALDRRDGRLVWRFDGERGFVGVAEPPRIDRGRVYWASGDAHAQALDLRTGRPLWRRPLRAGAEAFATCGSSLVVNTQGLVYLERRTGAERALVLDGAGEFTTGGLAVVGGRVLAAGPRGVYALACPAGRARGSAILGLDVSSNVRSSMP